MWSLRSFWILIVTSNNPILILQQNASIGLSATLFWKTIKNAGAYLKILYLHNNFYVLITLRLLQCWAISWIYEVEANWNLRSNKFSKLPDCLLLSIYYDAIYIPCLLQPLLTSCLLRSVWYLPCTIPAYLIKWIHHAVTW